MYGYGNDLGWISVSLGLTGDAGSAFAAALGEAYTAARIQAETFSGILGSEYQSPDGTIEWLRFVEESRRPAYRAVELQKAHSDVAAGWGAKSSKYVAIITILAAALFLLGLTVNVVRDSQIALVGTGVGLALAATLWGVTVWSSPVFPVSERSIDAYVDGAIAETTYVVPADLQFAERRLDDALEANPRYREAYLARGMRDSNRTCSLRRGRSVRSKPLPTSRPHSPSTTRIRLHGRISGRHGSGLVTTRRLRRRRGAPLRSTRTIPS